MLARVGHGNLRALATLRAVVYTGSIGDELPVNVKEEQRRN